ncbi:MAG: UDP-2,3-diacylglucosamine diphosphatase [Moraxellaceae bacterium]
MSKTYFISDLHLYPELPRITAGFFKLLENIRGADALYVLGDLFEVWVGDDNLDPYNQSIVNAFRALSDSGTRLYVLHGNRDFLLGAGFAAAIGGELLPEDKVIDCYGHKILIMHGDQLCTLDEKYMAFRAQSRAPAWQQMILDKTLDERHMIATMWRMQSKANSANKPENIMDVTPVDVVRVLEENGVQTLLHGHTHRPAVHNIEASGKAAQRVVLGDWREEEGTAVIAMADDTGLHPQTWSF